MPMFEFKCKKCNNQYETLTSFDKTGKYSKVACPKCNSKKKENLISLCQHTFSDPVGTDKWNSDSTGHDYRFKHNTPKVKAERERAEALSHMGADPYGSTMDHDLNLGEGIHDPEFRPGLS